MTVYTHLGAVDKLSIATGAAANSTIKNNSLPLTVAVHATVDFHVLIAGGTPTATVNDFMFPAGVVHYFNLDAGQELSIRGSNTGTAYVQRVLQASD